MEVQQVVSENQLSVCAILESHVNMISLTSVCAKVFRSWEWTSNANLCNKGCRIILGWNKDLVDVMIMAQTNQTAHAKVIHHTDRKAIYSTFIYASNDSKERRLLWADLGLYKLVVRGLPWVLLGDFNVTLNMEDVCTGSSIMSSVLCDFKDCVNNIEVVDINSTDIHFTWNQKPKNRDDILTKLDRIMGNLDFIDSFQGAYANFQPYRISDHTPAVLKIPSLAVTKPKPFKFYNFIALKGNFLDMVATHWNTSVDGYSMF
ncbi:RNA-directed DNA polymerase, eukaryota, reverse transcriptase zinc-binding domain protein [Tanacetum coccineum]